MAKYVIGADGALVVTGGALNLPFFALGYRLTRCRSTVASFGTPYLVPTTNF